jgi:cobalt/nickel transport system permease protein
MDMHLGSQAITPECAWLGVAATTAGLGIAHRWGRTAADVRPHSLAAWGAVVFAAQMINLPVGSHSSAHFIGGFLLARLFGPLWSTVTLGMVLLVQALWLGDGAWQAWGVNTFNMGVVPALLFLAATYWPATRRAAESTIGVALGSSIAVLLAALIVPLEVAWGRPAAELVPWQSFFTAMIALHLVAAPLEAVCAALALWCWQSAAHGEVFPARRRDFALASIAFVLALMSSFISSSLPDGYEAAADASLAFVLKAGTPPWPAEVISSEPLLALLGTGLTACFLLLGTRWSLPQHTWNTAT